MLDAKTTHVLRILQKECPGSNYKVIDKSDIISAMPQNQRLDEDTLEHIITFLERNECIQIKYEDENVYCLCVLPTVKQLAEKESKTKKEKPKNWLFLILIMIFSLMGGILGAIIGKFINF